MQLMGLYPSTYVDLELVIIYPFYGLAVIHLDCSVQLVDFAIFMGSRVSSVQDYLFSL